MNHNAVASIVSVTDLIKLKRDSIFLSLLLDFANGLYHKSTRFIICSLLNVKHTDVCTEARTHKATKPHGHVHTDSKHGTTSITITMTDNALIL